MVSTFLLRKKRKKKRKRFYTDNTLLLDSLEEFYGLSDFEIIPLPMIRPQGLQLTGSPPSTLIFGRHLKACKAV